jgi:hypothetical protein
LASLFAVLPSGIAENHPSQNSQKELAALSAVSPSEALVDPSQLQWASPTSGPPISLEYVPRGSQVILHLRPAELSGHSEGAKVLAALGRWGEQTAARVEEFTGAKLADIDSLLVALVRVNGRWDCALRAKFKNRPAELPPTIAGRIAFVPTAGQGRVLVSCPTAIANELKEQGDLPTLLARDLERLLPLSDQHRSATLLLPTKFLDAARGELFADGGEMLIAGFEAVVPDNASTVLVSCDWRRNFFCELAATIVQNAPAHRFNRNFAAHLGQAAERMADWLATNPPPAYGSIIAERFPAMLGVVSDFTRVSHEREIALARCYLPVQAGHNLVLAGRLRVCENLPAAEISRPPKSLSEQLRQVTTLSFPRETLENALKMLAADTKLPIQIAGRDLQLEGITKNQTFALDVRNRPVEEVLVEVLRRANPDRDAAGPDDPRQKLVYVIGEGGIIVTTRAAAAERAEDLPKVFASPRTD